MDAIPAVCTDDSTINFWERGLLIIATATLTMFVDAEVRALLLIFLGVLLRTPVKAVVCSMADWLSRKGPPQVPASLYSFASIL